MRIRVVWLLLSGVVFGGNAAAQLTSDVVPRFRLIPRAEQVRRELEESTRRIGPFRIDPQFFLREVGYTDNVFGVSEDEEKVSDVSGSVAAGARWILPFGPKGYLRGGVLPEYTWSQEFPERRFLGGTYDVSALALFNRLALEGTAGQARSLAYPSSETETEAIGDLTFFGVDGELDVSGYISVFASARGEDIEYDQDVAGDPVFIASSLNRDDRALRAGLRYRLTSFFELSVAGERTESAFEERPLERDNTSEALLVGLHYQRPRAYLNATIGQREGKPQNGSSFEPYDETVGSYFGAILTGGPIELQGFGHRTVRYGLDVEAPYYFETRNGIGTVITVGSRLRLRASGEVGTHDYPFDLPGPGSLRREDDVTTYGAGFDMRVYRNVALTVFVSETDLDSNLDSFDRSIVRVQTGITFTGDFPR